MTAQGNIIYEKLIAATTLSANYEDEQGFFVRATTGGTLKYEPVGNDAGDYIEKTIDSGAYFTDPVVMKKIYASGTTAQGIYIGKGV